MKARSTRSRSPSRSRFQVRGDVRRLGRLRSRRRLRAEPAADTGWDGAQQPVINVSWDDAQHYVAWLSRMTGKPYRLLPKPNGNMRRAPARRRPIPGATRSARGTPIATAAAASGTAGRPRRSVRSSPMRSACTTWRAMCGNGSRIAITTTTMERQRWFGVDRGRMQSPRRPRRFLAQLSTKSPLGLPMGSSAVGRDHLLGFRVGRTVDR